MAIFISQKKLESEVSKRAAESCDAIISEMGAELHDDLIQKLSIFRLYIDRIGHSSSDKAEVDKLVIKTHTEFEQVIKAVKSISRRLLPVRMEGDTIVNMVDMLCQNMEQPGTGHIHFQNEGTARSLENTTEIYLLRITQELIHNAFKHSSAWHVWVRLKWTDRKLILEVEDDGSGFSKIPEFIQMLKKKNNTLKMRAQAIGATIQYKQSKNGLMAIVEHPLG